MGVRRQGAAPRTERRRPAGGSKRRCQLRRAMSVGCVRRVRVWCLLAPSRGGVPPLGETQSAVRANPRRPVFTLRPTFLHPAGLLRAPRSGSPQPMEAPAWSNRWSRAHFFFLAGSEVCSCHYGFTLFCVPSRARKLFEETSAPPASPNWRHTTRASVAVKPSSHTVPHRPL